MHILEYFIFRASQRGSLHYPSNFQWPCNILHTTLKSQYYKQRGHCSDKSGGKKRNTQYPWELITCCDWNIKKYFTIQYLEKNNVVISFLLPNFVIRIRPVLSVSYVLLKLIISINLSEVNCSVLP